MAITSIRPSWLDENPLRLFPDVNLFFEEDLNTVTNTVIYAMLLITLIQFLKSLSRSQLIDVMDDQDLRDDQDRERLNNLHRQRINVLQNDVEDLDFDSENFEVLHDNWNNTDLIPDIPANQPSVNNFGEPLEENEEPHQILIDENVTNENEIEDFHTSRNNVESDNNLLQNEEEQANPDEVLPVPDNEIPRDVTTNVNQNNPEPFVAQPIESLDFQPTKYEQNQANNTESFPELPTEPHVHNSNSDNRLAEENDEENMTLAERLWMQADALFADALNDWEEDSLKFSTETDFVNSNLTSGIEITYDPDNESGIESDMEEFEGEL